MQHLPTSPALRLQSRRGARVTVSHLHQDFSGADSLAILVILTPGARRRAIAAALLAWGADVTFSTAAHVLEDMDGAFASDLVLLDGPGAGLAGPELCRHLLQRGGPPIILLTGSDDEKDFVTSLEVGADDCFGPSATLRTLLARISALVRRSAIERTHRSSLSPSQVYFAGWSFCLYSRRLRSPAGETEFLPRRDHELLTAFVQHQGTVLTPLVLGQLTGHEGLFDERRQADFKVRVLRLRRRLERLDAGSDLIRTVKYQGYLFVPDVHVSEPSVTAEDAHEFDGCPAAAAAP